VAAVDELLSKRRANRLIAMGEASLWVAGGLALASVLNVLPAMPTAYSVSAWTIVGGALLGFGAWVNKACVFGAIARFGSGEWSYAATPVGFYIGCLTVGPFFAAPVASKLAEASPILRWSGVVAALFVLFASWRVLPPLLAALADRRTASSVTDRSRGLADRVWSPHAATGVIGVTFVIILLLVGAWAYTDVLAQLARGNTMRLALGLQCLVALYVGAILGGWTAGRLRNTPPNIAAVARCFAGGTLMAWGTLLIPGSNDGLILIGMPLLWPYAWMAFGTMCVTIGVAQVLARGAPKPTTA
jgi:toxin CptA